MRTLIRGALGAVLGAGALLASAWFNGNMQNWPWAEHTTPGNIGYVAGVATPGIVVGVCLALFAFRRKRA